jgi:hypothetical protein
MVVAVVVALAIGLWPVHVDVQGDATYSCGSGFVHSSHNWNVDSAALEFQQTSTLTATGLPTDVCPDKVDNRRDLALLVLAFSLAIGLLFTLFLDRPRQPNFGTTMFANRRRPVEGAPMPARGAQSEDPSIT